MSFDEVGLAKYLRHRYGSDASLVQLERFPRGSSRETWFVTYREKSASAPVSIVLRSDLPSGSSDPTPLDQEYFLYERLGHTAVPVARALWWEDDPKWLGRVFYAREKVAGDWNIPHYSDPDPAYDALRIEIAQEHLRKIATVHAVDWKGLGFDKRLKAPRDEADAAHANIEVDRAHFDRIAIEGIPIVNEMCEWLHDHAPTAPKLCLCKGTNGYGEEVFRGGKIVAMSDWEECSIGDPAADFAFMQDFHNPIVRDGRALWGLDQALGFYREVSGNAVTKEAVGYYQVLRCFRLLALAHNAAVATRRPGAAFIKQAWTGTEVLHMSKHVLASAMGLMPPFPAERFVQFNMTVDSQ